MPKITIKGISLDPTDEDARLRQHALLSVDTTASNYILIQVRGPLSADQKVQLRQLNVESLEFIPTDTYVCKYKSTDLQRILVSKPDKHNDSVAINAKRMEDIRKLTI